MKGTNDAATHAFLYQLLRDGLPRARIEPSKIGGEEQEGIERRPRGMAFLFEGSARLNQRKLSVDKVEAMFELGIMKSHPQSIAPRSRRRWGFRSSLCGSMRQAGLGLDVVADDTGEDAARDVACTKTREQRFTSFANLGLVRV